MQRECECEQNKNDGRPRGDQPVVRKLEIKQSNHRTRAEISEQHVETHTGVVLNIFSVIAELRIDKEENQRDRQDANIGSRFEIRAADDVALQAMGIDSTDWSVEAVRALTAKRAKDA